MSKDGVLRVTVRVEHRVDASAVVYIVGQVAVDLAYKRHGRYDADHAIFQMPWVSKAAVARELRRQLWLYGLPEHWGELPIDHEVYGVAGESATHGVVDRPCQRVIDAATARVRELWPEFGECAS